MLLGQSQQVCNLIAIVSINISIAVAICVWSEHLLYYFLFCIALKLKKKILLIFFYVVFFYFKFPNQYLIFESYHVISSQNKE